MKTVSGMDLKEVLITIRNQTQPIDGHPDPKSIEDCWNEVSETFENQNKGVWERMEDAYGELEGFMCERGHQSDAATHYCSNCGRKMSGGEAES
jgi:hypothetical protein